MAKRTRKPAKKIEAVATQQAQVVQQVVVEQVEKVVADVKEVVTSEAVKVAVEEVRETAKQKLHERIMAWIKALMKRLTGQKAW